MATHNRSARSGGDGRARRLDRGRRGLGGGRRLRVHESVSRENIISDAAHLDGRDDLAGGRLHAGRRGRRCRRFRVGAADRAPLDVGEGNGRSGRRRANIRRLAGSGGAGAASDSGLGGVARNRVVTVEPEH